MSDASRLVALGMPPSLASEVARQNKTSGLTDALGSVVSRYPGSSDDINSYYVTGDDWQINNRVYQCRNNAAGRAFWVQLEDTPALLGDRFGSATAGAYGTRKLVSGYSGPLIDVMVSKNSGTLSIVTIGQDANGAVDQVALSGAAAGMDGQTFLSVVRIYDQTGNGNHLTAPGFVEGATTISISALQCPHIGVRRTADGVDLISWSGAAQVTQYLQFPSTLSSKANAFTMLMLGAVSCSNSPPQASYTLASLGSAAGQAVSLTLGGNNESGRITIGEYDPLTVTGTSTATLNTQLGMFGCSGRGGDQLFIHAPDSGTASNSVKLPSGFSNRVFAGGAIGASLIGGTNAVANSAAMQLFGLVLFNRALSDGEVSAASVDVQAAYNFAPQIRIRLDCLGSSTTQGYLNSDGWCWPQMLPDYTPPMKVRSWAVPGATASDFLANTIGNVVADSTAVTRKWAITWYGNNDLIQGQTVAQIIANVASIHTQLRAAGYERLFILAQYDATLNAAVVAAVANGTIDADAMIDPVTVGPLSNHSDTAIYHDGTHPTPAADRVIASVIAQAMQKYF